MIIVRKVRLSEKFPMVWPVRQRVWFQMWVRAAKKNCWWNYTGSISGSPRNVGKNRSVSDVLAVVGKLERTSRRIEALDYFPT